MIYRLSLLATLLLTLAGGARATELTVHTHSGELTGIREGAVTAFLGVPYAKPPVSELRWRAPERVEPWAGVREASHFGGSCYQPWPAPLFGPFTPEYVNTPEPSEDCLYLNVWTPATAGRGLPVLFWIHGGAFLGGSGSVPIYDGRHLAERDVVVVTINYRVGPFGFLAHPELWSQSAQGGSGNFGLLDMIAALRWVHENIAAFGGDPNQVTIAGQSAGAAAVNDLMVAPRAKGLFARAIAESGSGMGAAPPSREEAEKAGESFAQSLGAAHLAQLRSLPAEKIQAAVTLPLRGGIDTKDRPPRLPFSPVLDAAVLTANPEDPKATVQSAVPLLTGYCADEGLGPGTKVTVAGFERTVGSRYGAHAPAILALYPHRNDSEATASAYTLDRDRYMASLLLWSQERTRAAGQRIYPYLFDHPVPTAKPPSWGTFHTAEVPYVFRQLATTYRPYTSKDWAVADQLSEYWLNFIRHGDPNDGKQPTWHPASESGTDVMGLGDRVGDRPAVSSPERLAALRAFVADGGRLSLF